MILSKNIKLLLWLQIHRRALLALLFDQVYLGHQLVSALYNVVFFMTLFISSTLPTNTHQLSHAHIHFRYPFEKICWYGLKTSILILPKSR